MASIAGYQISDRLYEGLRSVVYRARKNGQPSSVILKSTSSPHPSLSHVARFAREFELLRSIQEERVERVVPALELVFEDQRPVLVFDDVGGRSLADQLEEGPVDLVTALRIGIQVASALEALHRNGIVHKDVKPANILTDPNRRRAWLIDLGVALRLGTDQAQTATTMEGSPAYMSPEQTGRLNRRVDRRSDLYCLGVTLYEMISGERPFDAGENLGPLELAHRHLAATPPQLHTVDGSVPQVLSRIVAKLMAKAPEDRYQSAAGLRADLERCLATLDKHLPVSEFGLAAHDVPESLQIPAKLYGRDPELAALRAAFGAVANGAARMMMVLGPGGSGKSALVDSIRGPVLERRGHFLGGKFDALQRAEPYSAFSEALGGFARHLLLESSEVLERWRQRLTSALAPNAAVLINLVPDMELVLGPQPEVPELEGVAARNRRDLVVRNLLRSLASAEHPLVLFLDDLHQADPGSLEMLERLLSDPDVGHVLVLGAYRDNEVDTMHPLSSTLHRLEESGRAPSRIGLRELDPPALRAWIGDALELAHWWLAKR